MDRLYIVEVDITSRVDVEVDAYTAVLEHLQDWLSSEEADTPRVDLLADGGAEVSASQQGGGVSRRARWRVRSAGGMRVLQVFIRQPLQGSANGTFATDITLFQHGDSVVLRVELGREVAAGLLVPASVRTLRRPSIVGFILNDARLAAHAQTQPVTGVPVPVKGTDGGLLADIVHDEIRLPLLIVDGRTAPAQGFARMAARELAGLVQVVVVDEDAFPTAGEALGAIGITIPSNGARLVWPGEDARHPAFSAADVQSWKRTTESLLRMVGGVSVLARGQNHLLRRLAAEERQEQEESFEQALAEAASSGNTAAEIDALRTRLATMATERDDALDLATDYEQQVKQLESTKAQGEYWKGEYLRLKRDRSAKGQTSWADAPALDSDDLHTLAAFLTETSNGAIVFTENSLRSWKQSKYPHQDEMSEHLIVLAQAAVAWREADCHIQGMLDDWFRTEWEVAMADTDGGLSKRGMDRFTFEGVDFSRLPHLKLDDHVSPSEVGRVYFAHDSASKRFIVDHVGMKLYDI